MVASRHGRPDQLIAAFAAKVDKLSPAVAESYGLLRPGWRPGGRGPAVPAGEGRSPLAGGEAP